MTRDTRGRRLAEWADLVGGSIPECAPDCIGDVPADRAPDPRDDGDADRR